ncbi:MalY/PatB family protein [Pelagovum pacificum]|uniref:cysteine-S-conjugate beta-lyase n=1 Tax=Pelagovum pacificum TaxID=2588711 RepID=A0A5C5GFX5_9RHOB|nr:PatB family C-S lyase [Pelagovum pacificum]QQA43202.1 PatB family C-S lyase [Pelagovum pacificum]TNY33658.1 putative C-S lyase [Pelagovum pacificum]
MSFDEPVGRAGIGSIKWDMTDMLGVTGEDVLPMWVADMDFESGPFIADALREVTETGFHGYFSTLPACYDAVAWWLETRHGWTVSTDCMNATHGIGNAIALCLDIFTAPGDPVAIMTPVYHEFTNKVRRNDREVRELPLAKDDNGLFALDFERWETLLTGAEKMLIISSPHNPAGRIWTAEEQVAIGDFCARHDLILLCDEIHHDLILPGNRHIPFPVAAPQHMDRTIMAMAASKTFNVAGGRTGFLIATDPSLQERITTRIRQFDIQPNRFGTEITRAAYSPAGAEWVDELTAYLAGNVSVFADGIAAIPGVSSMPMQSTYLAWVDFEALGMAHDEVVRRVHEDARIAPSPGPAFGTGGEHCMRFNLGTSRARVKDAVARLQKAFADVQ